MKCNFTYKTVNLIMKSSLLLGFMCANYKHELLRNSVIFKDLFLLILNSAQAFFLLVATHYQSTLRDGLNH